MLTSNFQLEEGRFHAMQRAIQLIYTHNFTLIERVLPIFSPPPGDNESVAPVLWDHGSALQSKRDTSHMAVRCKDFKPHLDKRTIDTAAIVCLPHWFSPTCIKLELYELKKLYYIKIIH